MVKYDKPLSSIRLKQLASIPPKEKTPSEILVNMGYLNLYEGSQASLVKLKELENNFKVNVTIPGKFIGKRIKMQNIPSQNPIIKKDEVIVKKLLTGSRPGYTNIKFFPERIELKLNEQRLPSVDFDYKYKDEILDIPDHVFPPENRYIYDDTNFPWITVGRVDTPLGYCTGCTIGSRLLLTASHCIQWNDDNTTGYVRFRPSYYNGDAPFGESWATNTIFWTKVSGGDGVSDQETAFDYVVCVLDSRIGDIVGYPGYRIYDSDWNGESNWQHMGYPSDLSGGERPSFQGDCIVSSVENKTTSGQTGYVLGHFNDVVGGHSGGPVWGWWENEEWPRIIGTHSTSPRIPGNNTSGDNEFGGGPALSSLISWARSNYP